MFWQFVILNYWGLWGPKNKGLIEISSINASWELFLCFNYWIGWAQKYYKINNQNPMGVTKTKFKPKKKVMTKKQKTAKRASKMQKLIEHRKRVKRERKGKVVPIKKKRQQEADAEIIDFTTKQNDQNTTDAEVNILSILGLTGDGNDTSIDWEKKLEQKLMEANVNSLDNPEVRRVYGEIGRIFATYRSGKVPKAFKVIPNLEKWREVLMITRPDNWTPQAMYQAVNIFASNFDPVRAEKFYEDFLVPAVRLDLKKNKKLNYHYYESLKKALYKTNAWFRGIMFKFCAPNTMAREISVIESLLSKMTIPVISSSVALIKLSEMEPCPATVHYVKALLSKCYNFPKKVIAIITTYFLKFQNFNEEMPVIWHQALLTFCRQYGAVIDEMSKSELARVAKKRNHKLITPEILKQLN